MRCEQCEKEYRVNKDSVKLYYFDKTIHFCSDNCYFEYSKGKHLSYWQWNRRFSKLTKEQKKKYYQNLNKVKDQLKRKVKNDLIWVKPLKPGHSFQHVSEYQTFNDFRKAVITFLKRDTLKDIYKDSWNFFCENKYKPSWQREQIKALNKIFDELYGKNKVRWGFFDFDDDHPYKKHHEFWGPYIVIDEETFIVHFPYRYTLDTFIKRRLKSGIHNRKSIG